MRFAFGVLSGSVVLGLAVAAAWASDERPTRIGIERVQADSGTDRSGARPQAGTEDTEGRTPSPETRGHNEDGQDDGGDGGAADRSAPDVREPPGCIYRDEPLGLIV